VKAVLRNLFVDTGRIARQPYWLGLVLTLAAIAAVFAASMQGRIDDSVMNILFFISQCVLAWLAGRRFKDLGFSPLRARIPMIVAAICAISALGHDDWDEIDDKWRTVKLALLLFYIFAPLLLVLLAGLLPGNAGRNRYGAPPNEEKLLGAVPTLFE